MLFNSLAYLIFLPIVFILYWAIPHKLRWVLLLIASYYFYMSWNAKYVIWILLTTLISYTAARLLERQYDKSKKKLILTSALVLCFSILFFFKYFNFFSNSISDFLGVFTLKMHPITLDLILPVGISFYTFQTISYVIDVYRGDAPVEHHFGIYATFISFFPQLVAGPIERTNNLLPQLKQVHTFDYDNAMYGAKLMLWGFYKKTVIADLLSPYVDMVYASVHEYSGFALVIITFFFAIQIYCDFSGYSDIAIGTAKLLGINLTINFKSPYFSSSIKEFWSRWHISLSTWFKDYIYIPLGGNRCSRIKHYFNLIVTFMISGLWHGANWTYVIWGTMHGVAQILENIMHKPLQFIKSKKFGKAILVFTVFVFCSIAFIFFRAETVSDAFYIISHLFDGITAPLNYLRTGFVTLGIYKMLFAYMAVWILLLMIYDYLNREKDFIHALATKHKIIQWTFYVLLGVIVVLFSQKGAPAEFVYFQF